MRPWEASGGPDANVLRRLVDEGSTDRQIAEMYDVAESTVRYWRDKAKVARQPRTPRLDHRATGAIPWPLNTSRGHHRDPIARLLRDRNRHKHGLRVDQDALGRIAQFEQNLAEMDLVVDYDRERGFITRQRDPKLDAPDSVVRIPPG